MERLIGHITRWNDTAGLGTIVTETGKFFVYRSDFTNYTKINNGLAVSFTPRGQVQLGRLRRVREVQLVGEVGETALSGGGQ